MSIAARRKVLISSDEESDAEGNQTYLDDVEEPSVVPPSDESGEEEVEEDSMASKSSGQLDQTGEEIISGSESFLSAKSFQDTSTHSSIVSSTPRIKIKNRTSTYDLEKSMAQFSISRKNPNGDGDRSRSFRTDNENIDFESPISRKLAEKDDPLSKQKLRERVLKKNALKDRNSGTPTWKTAEPLLETTLSPVVSTRRSLERSSHMSVDADESILSKNGVEDSDIVDESFQEAAVFIADGRNSSPEEEDPVVYISYNSPEFVEDSIQIIDDSNVGEKDKDSSESSGIIEISHDAAEKEDEIGVDEQEPEGETCLSDDGSRDEDSDDDDVVDDSMKDFIADDDDEEGSGAEEHHTDGEVDASSSVLDTTPPRRNPAPMDVNSIRRKVFISSDEEEESEAEADSEEEEEEQNSSNQKENDPSIVCLSSDDDEDDDIKKDDKYDQKDPVEVPKHLQEYMKEELQTLEAKKRTMENLVQKSLNLSDGGARLRETLKNLKEAIEWKKKVGDSKPADNREKKPTVPIIPPKAFDPSVYSRLLANDKKRLFGGKMTEGRFKAINLSTEKCIKGMHEAIATMPDENQTLETPNGLRLELMHHQKQGLAWMVWRETQNAPGGILADDMGLGKTLSTISLVLYQKNERLKRKHEGEDEIDKKKEEIAAKMGLTPSNTTLVVAPASVIYQWEAEIEKRVKSDRLSVHVYHGPKNKRIANPKRLARYDIVITTYNLVGTELMEKITTKNNEDDLSSDSYDEEDKKSKKAARRVLNTESVLAKVAFERIILDEAHQIKNKKTSASKAACSLAGRNRWCLSGTPIHNNLWDLYSLIRFLRVAPFEDETHWKEYIMTSSQKSADRLNILTKSLLLRRTKAQTCAVTQRPIVDLEPKVVEQHDIILEGIEGDIYDMMFRATQQHVKALMDQEDNEKYENLYGRRRKNKADTSMKNPFNFGGQKTIGDDPKSKFSALTCMLVMLLRLRQACVHLHLTQKAVDMEAFEHLGGDGPISIDDILEKTMAEMSLGEKDADSTGTLARSITAEEVFEPTYLSSKVKKVMEIVNKVLELGDKIVIVSQWTSLLNLVEIHLKEKTTRYTTISGAIAPSDRQERVDSFNKEGGGAKVLLLSLTAGGVGLNLVGGNHLIMVDLHWNPALEAQACDRIYRMGQKKKVYIHRLIAQGTIEQRVVNLQEQKLKLANDVLDGAASKKMNKLSMQDLKYLFNLDDEVKQSKKGTTGLNQTHSR